MKDFQKRNPYLHVFSAHLHMDEETPHVHVDFVPVVCNSKRGLDTRVSLKGALGEQGFKGGTRGATEWNQWIESEKQEIAQIMGRYGIEWKQLGTHNKHLSVLDFEKQERAKEVAELEQVISDSKGELNHILDQQAVVGQETEQIRQEVSELSEASNLLKEQTATLAEDKEKLLFDNEKLEKRQKKLETEIEKMAQSKATLERNIYAYDEEEKWQLAEPRTLMSAKAYRDKKALPLVEKLKEVIKALTIKCVQLTEQGKKLAAKSERQEEKISRLTNRIMDQENVIDKLQEKTADLGRLERCLGKEQVQSIIEQSKALEQAEKANQHPKRVFEMGR